MKFIIKSKGGDESKSFANQFDAICRARKNELLEEEFSTHTKKLEEINTLEKKINYWCDNLPTYSLLKPLSYETEVYKLNSIRLTRKERDLLFSSEINRLINNELDTFCSTSILS